MNTVDPKLLSRAMIDVSQSNIASQLLQLEVTKTWSLIATVFGDLDGDEVSGKDLWNLLEPLGIKPEAMRVALHRLKKDGWIVSNRVGREVVYRLSDHGRQETIVAQKDVYRKDVKFSEGWRLVLLHPDATVPDGIRIPVDKHLLLVPVGGLEIEDAIELPAPDTIPEWFEERLVPEHILRQAVELTSLATRFLENENTQTMPVSVRLMFINYWRKMALRPGVWAHIGMVPSGVMAQCHVAMCRVFDSTNRTHASH